MKIILVLFAICTLIASSEGEVLTGACSTEGQRRAAVDKALASIGCDSYECSKSTSYKNLFLTQIIISSIVLLLNLDSLRSSKV